MEYTLFFVCGLASLLGSIAGFGGGIFVVPTMVLIFQIPIEIAIGVTAISLFPSSLISTLANWTNKNIDFKMVVLLEIPTVIGAFCGAYLTSLVPTKPLEITFALFLFFLSWTMFKPPQPDKRPNFFSRQIYRLNNHGPSLKNRPYTVGYYSAGIFGFLAGTLAGIFGIGGGILKTPLMLKVFKVPLRTATGTALCMIVITSFVSGSTHYNLGHFDINVLIPAFSGFAGGALMGVWIGLKLRDKAIAQVVASSIFLAAMATLTHALML